MKKTIQRVLVFLTMAWSVTTFGHHMNSVNSESELDANLTRLPAHQAGRLTAKACTDCDTENYRVDSNTAYYVGHQTSAVSLNDFRLATAAAKQNDRVHAGAESEIGLLVIFDPDTRVAVKVVLET